MAFNSFLFLLLLSFLALASSWGSAIADSSSPILDISSLNRSSFPKGFIFGTASAAYQYEGAANIDGRGPSIWDTFCHKYPEKIKDGKNGDVAVDAYHRYKEDVKIMKELNLDAYRFSISWSRVLPKGKLSGGVNQEGIRYYHNLIDQLLAKALTPFVTIFHWDLPQALEDEYGGFLSHRIVNDFRDYSELCFKEFGDKVKHWITLNEPLSYSKIGYSSGKYAPGRCSSWLNQNCTGGDSGTEPYLVSHNLLLAHAAAVKVYKTKYQKSQSGVIGISLITDWFVPLTDKKEDKQAALRALDFMFGWYMTPLTSGEYPESMRTLVKNRLPKFTKEESRLLKGSFDFLGLNYYSSQYASDAPSISTRSYYKTDSLVNVTNVRNGMLIGPMAASDWLYIYPRGFLNLLIYIKTKYNNPVIYITENGYDESNDPTLSLEESLMDTYRIDYLFRHLYYLRAAIRDGVNVKGYFIWSLLDNFEWSSGYTVRFGLSFVDYKYGLNRYEKLSAKWLKNFLKVIKH